MDDPALFSPDRLRAYVADVQPQQAPSGRLTKTSKAALIAANLADALSTDWAMHQGATEANPLYGEEPSRWRLYGIKAAGTLGQMLALSKLAESRPQVANWTAKGIAAGLGLLTAHNIRQGHRSR